VQVRYAAAALAAPQALSKSEGGEVLSVSRDEVRGEKNAPVFATPAHRDERHLRVRQISKRATQTGLASVAIARTHLMRKLPGASQNEWINDVASKCAVVGLTGANANYMIDRGNEDLAIADLTGLGGALDSLDCFLYLRVCDGNLDLDLRHKLYRVLGAAIDLSVTFLTPEPLDLGHRHALHTQLGERAAYVIEFEGLYNCADEFHRPPPLLLSIMGMINAAGSAGRIVLLKSVCCQSGRGSDMG
jgi:hypothetical protein